MSKYFQIGSIKAIFRKLALFSWHNIRKFGNLSLADIWKTVKQIFRWLTKPNWLKLLNVIELLLRIINHVRSLLFCKQTHVLFNKWDNYIPCRS